MSEKTTTDAEETKYWHGHFNKVLGEEIESVRKRRRALDLEPERTKTPDGDGEPHGEGELQVSNRMELFGIALSGGGIRSATVAIGFFQALSRLNLLKRVDYLSSVSGGSYASAWLAAWLRREATNPAVANRPNALENVQQQLSPARIDQAEAERGVPVKESLKTPQESEPEPMRHLRAYSRYWTPTGLLGLDGWALANSYVRNALVNMMFLFPLLCAAVLLLRLLKFPVDHADGLPVFVVWGFVLLGSLMLAVGSVASLILMDRRHPPSARADANRWMIPASLMVFAYVAMVVREAYRAHVKSEQSWETPIGFLCNILSEIDTFFAFGVIYAGVAGIAVAWVWNRTGKSGCTRSAILAEVLFGATFGGLLWVVLTKFVKEDRSSELVFAAVPPLIALAAVAGGYVSAALNAGRRNQVEREWRGRMGGVIVRVAFLWGVASAVVFFLPQALAAFVPNWVAGLTWASAAAALKALTGSAAKIPAWLKLQLVTLAAVVVLVGFVVFATALVDSTVSLLKPWLQARKIDIPAELVPFVLTIVLAAFAGLSIPVNLFSTQSLYQNRLVRCYLGASRPKIDFPLYGHEPQATDDPLEIRRGVPTHVNPDGTIAGAMVGTRVVEKFVDFDAADDLPLAALADPEYVGPYPIFNTMMSTAGTEDMAVADRRGESFFITPMRLGNPRLGFAKLPSIQSLESNGNQLTLGRAFSVSGAAADANNRTVPSGPLSILAGILNLRWGVWTRSPHPKAGAWDSENGAWPGGEPGAMWPYLEELSGSTRGTGKYVYLTDAGHFDNSGVYELIRRRCRFIVFLDAAEDVFAASENLANVIRLVRTDFGVRIDIDPATLTKGPDGISASHVAVGAIRYDDLGDGLGVGTFVFVRSSLTGDEPADLKNFALTNPPFPHDSSFRMAFSDERFESYRELGFHLGISTFAAAADELKRAESKIGKNARRHNRWLFSLVRNRWSNQPTDAYAKYSAAVAPWYQVENALRDRPCLKKANLGMYPELSQNLLGLEALDDCTLDEIHVFAELVEMMETSWMDMGLDEHAANPLHRGWMNCYRRWTATPQLHKYWPIFRPQYSAQFVRFCERALNLERPEVAVRASEDVPEPQRQAFVERLRAEFHGEWKWNLKGEGDGDATTKFGDPFAALGGKRVFFPVHPSPGAGTPWLPEYPLGIAIVGPKAEGPRTLFFYVRGGFRSANIGRRALRSLIEDTLEPDEMREEYVVRLPRLALTLNERSVEGRWIAFFNDFGFYPEKGVDAKAEIVLVRKPMGH